MNVPNGLTLKPIDIGQDFILGGYGSLGGDVLQPDGQWTGYLPDNESQLDVSGFDAIACTSFNTLNAVEILNRRLFGTDRNWSDRFLAKASNTTPQGNDPHTVAETLRKLGAPNEADYPYPPTIKTWDDFYAAIPKAIYSLATVFIAEFAFFHEYVVTQPSYLKTALTYSPVCVSVTAWFKEGDYYVHQPGMADNHWTVLVGYKEGDYWLCYDSYDPGTLKKLRWDFKFTIAKRYRLDRQIRDERSWTQWLVDVVRAAFGLPKTEPIAYTPTTPPAPITATPTQQPAPVSTVPPAPAPLGDEKLIAALIQVESQGNDNAIGDRGLAHKAYGCLQIRQPVCDDVNRVYGTGLKAQDMLGDRALSIDTFRKYVSIYRCATDEEKARIWNGGPSAKRKGTAMYAATTIYWGKVKRYL